MSVALLWFRRDLRLADQPALTAALRHHDRVLPLYIHAPHEEAPWQPGAASRWWLHRSLAALDADLRKRGSSLHIRAGDALPTLRAVIAETGAAAVYWNRLYEPAVVARDAKISAALREDGVDAQSFNAALLFEPWDILTAQNGPYRVFTPFWRNARARLQARPPLPEPRRIDSPSCARGATLESLKLLPEIAWDAGLRAQWRPGEAGARVRLRRLFDAVGDYPAARDVPGEEGTSRLSPHLHFGEISPMQIVWALEEAARETRSSKLAGGAEAFVRELGWREFSHHLLHHFPESAGADLNAAFAKFRWARKAPARIARWQRGSTGIPMIDAGMRQLWATGWMHNRVRMLVASFLSKNMRQHWLEGARWFWDTLVDADLANNTQGWQWTAGTGADAAPYFRIFNPVTQGRRFDPDGAYIRRWVRELRDVPAPLVHEPWTDPATLARTGYPAPMIDLGASRTDALAAYRALRAG